MFEKTECPRCGKMVKQKKYKGMSSTLWTCGHCDFILGAIEPIRSFDVGEFLKVSQSMCKNYTTVSSEVISTNSFRSFSSKIRRRLHG